MRFDKHILSFQDWEPTTTTTQILYWQRRTQIRVIFRLLDFFEMNLFRLTIGDRKAYTTTTARLTQ